nr:UDP-glycosyltransferase [Paris polyphylla]
MSSLRIVFLPMLAAGHMIPMVDTARLLAARGVKCTIVTTPANAPVMDRAKRQNNIEILLIPFPSAAVGIPEGMENFSASNSPEFKIKFFEALDMLRHPFDRILTDLRPDCIVTDMLFIWSADVAAEHRVPRLAFFTSSFFSQCAPDAIYRHNLLESSPADVESFVVPGLPDRIEMLKSQILNPKFVVGMEGMMRQLKETVEQSYGVLVNSFYELEPEYVRHCREVVGWRAWHVGPVSLCNVEEADKVGRGGDKNKISSESCLEWLDGKEPGSVLYVCFGSEGEFTAAQLDELAVGLEASGCPFMWVVRSEVLPAGFEEKVEGRGMVARGWAPQISILSHRATGGFLTHCGWNSSMEGLVAGLPMVTWPLAAEQFYNERLLVDVLGVGVAVGVEKTSFTYEDRLLVGSAAVERAVGRVMASGEEADNRRRRARELSDLAKGAVLDGGSSFVEIGNLIKELTDMRNLVTKNQ